MALSGRAKEILSNGDILGQTSSPRVVWSYWDKGEKALSHFRTLCVETWLSMNPGWEVLLLDADSVWNYIDASALPRQWNEMIIAWQTDAIRLALLAEYGGIWMDVATICLKPFDAWIYEAIASDDCVEDLGAFYFHDAAYVENWFLAARRQHPLMLAWHRTFNMYFDSISLGTLENGKPSLEPLALPRHPYFRHINLDHLNRFGVDNRAYLVMHACFKKLIDEDLHLRRIWQHEMLLFCANDGALWHLDEPAVAWSVERGLLKWLRCHEQAWLHQVLTQCPILKFTRQFAMALDQEVPEALLNGGNSLGGAFQAVLSFDRVD